MARVLLVVSAVLVALLAFLLGRPWLYAAAGIPLAMGLGVTAWRLWTGRARRGDPASGKRTAADAGEEGPRESLRDLGIMEVRQQERREDEDEQGDGEDARSSRNSSRGDASDSARPRPRSTPEGTSAAAREPAASTASDPASPDRHEDGAATAERAEDTPSDEPPQESADDEASAEEGDAAAPDDDESGTGDRPTTTDPAKAPVLTPFVQSLRAALGARTACYLVQEDVVPAYRIRAIASADPDVRTTGTFETAGPLLTATMSSQPVTIRGLEGEKAVSDYLGYYESSPDIDHVALAPVRRQDDPHTHFLLVDADPGTDLGTRTARDILKSYADTLRLLLDGRIGTAGDANGQTVEDLFAGGDTTSASEAAAAEAAADRSPASPDPSEPVDVPGPADASDPAGAPSPAEQQGPRPRREIIQEEMEAADAEGDPLALALVHLNRAEAIAREGETAVASAEKLLRARLEENAPGFRVARFGELTYGIFVREDIDDVEAWAADLQDTFDRATGRLEGGVSIGVAVRTVHNDGPEELRADATEALRQAYQTGTCTIVE